MKLYKSKELAQDLIAGSECETQAVLYTSWGSLGFLGVQTLLLSQWLVNSICELTIFSYFFFFFTFFLFSNAI
jgi:hypothetical protein